MTEPDFSLMLEHFKRIHDDLAILKTGQISLMQRMSAIETHMAAFHTTEVSQYADLGEIRLRLDRIERRLGLREEA